MDIGSCKGAKAGFCRNTTKTIKSPNNGIRQRKVKSHKYRNSENDFKRGNKSSSTKERIFSESFVFSREKRGRSKTRDKSKKLKQFFELQSFQNGGYPFSEGPNPKRGLDDKARSYRGLLFGGNSRTTSKISSIQVGGEDLSICLSPIWNIDSPSGVYKVNECSDVFVTKNRNSSSNLLRRYSDNESKQGKLSIRWTESYASFASPGIWDKHGQISSDSISSDGVFGVQNQFSRNDTIFASKQSKEHTETLHGSKRVKQCLSEKVITTNWYNDCINSSGATCPSSLSVFTSSQEPKTLSDLQLQCHPFPKQKCFDRIKLVDRSFRQVEWEKHNFSPTNSNNSVRCKPIGVGSCKSRSSDRGSMVELGEMLPYKCIGTSGSNQCSQVFSKRSIKCDSFNSDRQQNYSSLHKQNGGNKITKMQSIGPPSMGMVLRQGDNVEGGFSAREDESNSRLGITSPSAFQQLEIEPTDFSSPFVQNNELRNRSFCRQNKSPTPSLYELASGSRGEGLRCSNTSLGRTESLCFSPVLSDISVSHQNSGRKSNSFDSNPCLDIPAMVHSSTRDVHSGSNPTSPESTASNIVLQPNSPSGSKQNAPISRLACIRRSFSSIKLSENVRELLISSWGEGTNKAYDSAWNKWASWCLERETDPFTAPLASVLEFLAWMFINGFQYRTVNVHRSALSSVLPHIDGNPVGKSLLVKRLMRGILRKKPPLPRYKETWDLDLVLKYLNSLGNNSDLDLKVLSRKLAILLAITAPKRVSEIVRLDIRFMHVRDNEVVFQLPGLSKCQNDSTPKEVVYCKFPDNPKLCVVQCLLSYLSLTENFRDQDKIKPNPLLRTLVKPHKQLSPTTLSNWIKNVMSSSGIDTNKFKAHSTRSASTSKAKRFGVSIEEIMKMADWSSISTFKNFYHRPYVQCSQYGSTVLSIENGSSE